VKHVGDCFFRKIFFAFPFLLEHYDTVRKRSQTLVAPIQSCFQVGQAVSQRSQKLAAWSRIRLKASARVNSMRVLDKGRGWKCELDDSVNYPVVISYRGMYGTEGELVQKEEKRKLIAIISWRDV